MRILFTILLLASAASAQCTYTAQFPSAVATAANIYNAGDNLQPTLMAPMNTSDGVAVVSSSAGWTANMIATVENEKMLVTGVLTNVLQVTRGFRGTTATSHAIKKTVSNFINCDYHQSVAAEMMAVQSELGAHLSNVFGRVPSVRWDDTTSSTGYSAQIGAVTPQALFRAMQNCPTCTANDGASGVVTIPQTSTNWEGTGLFGGVSNSSTTTNAVGGRFYARAVADGTGSADVNRVRVWALNTLMEDQTYGTGSTGPYNATVFDYTYLLNELDFNVGGPHTKVLGMSFGGNSTAQPESAIALMCSGLGSGIRWDACITSQSGASTKFASIGTVSAGNNTTSQPIEMFGRNSGGTTFSAGIFVDATGLLRLAMNTSGGGVVLQDGLANDVVKVTNAKLEINSPMRPMPYAVGSLPAAAAYNYAYVLCVACTASSSPCTAGGSTVLARSDGAQWNCGSF